MSLKRSFRWPFAAAAAMTLLWGAASSSCATTKTPGTGGGVSMPSCSGTVTNADCTKLGVLACSNTLGCTPGGQCGGDPQTCGALATSTACGAQVGCSWMGTASCSGVPFSCSGNSNMASCQAQKGCTWSSFNQSCTGVPSACTLIPLQTDCMAQQGCSWVVAGVCNGAPAGCATISGSVKCGKQVGCMWTPDCSGKATACSDVPAEQCAQQTGCTCDNCEGLSTSSGSSTGTSGGDTCTKQSDCDPGKNPCFTGDCINGTCPRLPGGCTLCNGQADCDPLKDGCNTGDCINGVCSRVPNCLACKVQQDCLDAAMTNQCFTGDCVNAVCGAKTMCTSGDSCCPPGCTSATDSDCQ